jgi:hypothetical protein
MSGFEKVSAVMSKPDLFQSSGVKVGRSFITSCGARRLRIFVFASSGPSRVDAEVVWT